MKESEFRKILWKHYRTEGRHTLPWRKTHDPYKILISEIMLQQTQVDRVLPYYTKFLQRFPNTRTLAQAPLREVLTLWQGLGYNRRGKYLHEAAKTIVATHKGKFPKDEQSLRALPGIGPYTAGALAAFAFNKPVTIIETNIRTVFTHHFFPHQAKVPDAAILELVEKTVDRKRSREWYYALMDYGSHLKRNGVHINHQSKHYTKQSKFEGSNRQLRGQILKILLTTPNAKPKRIATQLRLPVKKVTSVYTALQAELTL